jgi:hypothetical protein
MAFPEELNESGVCTDCKAPLPKGVYQSGAGYYIGTFCPRCGPDSRLSDYFRTRAEAEAELALWDEEGVRPHGRTTGFWGGS